MKRTATLTIAAVAVAGLAAPAALASPKPVKKTYTATAATPDPTNLAPDAEYSVCEQRIPGSFHIHEFKVEAPGTLKVTLSKYQGDWDLLIMNSKDKELAISGELTGDEVAQVKFKKADVAKIVACNWAGGPTGEVTYQWTPAKKK